MEDGHMVTCLAIMCLTILEASALLSHTDGALFLPVAGIIAGLAGYHVRPKIEGIKKRL